MCMLFIKPKSLVLPAKYHDSLWDKNSDGMSVWNKQKKSLFKTLCKKEAYDYLVQNAESELVIHYRYGTSGKTTLAQLHGFDIIDNNYLLFHNGVLSSFKGTGDLSDTQNLVYYFNENGYDLYEVIDYLEKYERSSRFLIVDKRTNEIHKPKCSRWNDVTLINGYEVIFSNSYAIDHDLLGFDGWYFDGYDLKYDHKYDHKYDMLDNPDFEELDYIINSCSEKVLIDFIQCNPEIIAQYLKEINREF